jgi:hypothetical protein|eukprot:COSAG01_NODE_3045_length_6671_cov_14.931396_3_plen_128_part_00
MKRHAGESQSLLLVVLIMGMPWRRQRAGGSSGQSHRGVRQAPRRNQGACRGAQSTGWSWGGHRLGDDGIAHKTTWLRFPFFATFFRFPIVARTLSRPPPCLNLASCWTAIVTEIYLCDVCSRIRNQA